MSDLSARLELPILQPSQAQKHVTHNKALQRLDALVQMVLEATEVDTPPGTPQEGTLWAIGPAPTDDWAGQAGQLAQWAGPGWVFITPQEGWRAWDRAAGTLKIFDSSTWTLSTDTQNLPGTGINATWDPTNRLSVASDATLLSHDGTGHQLKLNKAATADTASLLYQTNFTGHAEMGLTGNDDFSIKVSADGSAWTDAVIVDAVTGTLTGAAVQTAATDIGPGKLARADYVYGPGNLLGTVSTTGGVPDGAVIESGSNANGKYTRFADGTQICSRHFGTNNQTHVWTYPAAFISAGQGNLALSALPFGGAAITATVNWTPSNTSAEFKLWNATGAAVASQLHVSAVGRWR